MAWTHIPQHQQRGSQREPSRSGGAPAEATEGRAAQDHDLADLEVAGTSEPQRGIAYSTGDDAEEQAGGTPTRPEGKAQDWDNVVQPERGAKPGTEPDRDEG